MEYIIITTTFSDENEAKQMAQNLLSKRLIACGQIGHIESIYMWKDKNFDTKEYILTMKTKFNLFNEVEKHIKENHSYEVAEIVATPIANISSEYASWIDASVI